MNNTQLLPESNNAGSKHNGPEALIHRRLTTLGRSIGYAEVIVGSNTDTAPEMASRVLNLYRSNSPAETVVSQQVKKPKAIPTITREQIKQHDFLVDDENNMNPIIFENIAKELAIPAEESKHDFQESLN